MGQQAYGQAHTELAFGYAKVHSKWGLHIRVDDDIYHINDAPRVLRLAAVGMIDGLLDELLGAAAALLIDLHKRSEQLRSDVKELTGG